MTASNDLDALRAAAASGAPDDLHRLGAALVAALRMEDAFDAYSRAAAGGHAGAMIEAGRMAMYGVGTALDVGRAVQAFERAEAAGQPVAGYFLALLGVGDAAVPRDERIGARLLAAVQAGHPPALRAAAIHFGRKPDLRDQSLAIQLLDHAAGRGDAIAAQLLAERVRRGEGVTANPEAAAQLKARLREGGFPDLPEIVAVPAAPRRPVPSSTLALDEVLDPPDAEVLRESPRVAVLDGLLSVDECRLLVATAQPLLQARGVGAVPLDPLMEDLALRLVQLRLAAAAGAALVDAEPLVLRRVAIGEALHDDDRAPRVEAGRRRRTLHAWLAAPADGGALRLDDGRSIEPKAGRAVVIDALDADGRPLAPQPFDAEPVRRGEAWLATLHLREHRCRDA